MRRDYLLHTFLFSAVLLSIGCQRAEMQYQTPTAANLARPQQDDSKGLNQDKKTEWKTILSGSFSSISFADEKRGIATGVSEYYWLTSDGGLTWSEHNVRPYKLGTYGENNLVRSAMSRSGAVFAIGHIEDAGSEIFSSKSPLKAWKIDTYWNNSLNDLSIVDDQVWVVGSAGSSGIVLHSKDGQNWKRIWKSNDFIPNSVCFLNNTTGWMAGNGKILHTKDGGRTWMNQTIPTEEGLLSIAFADLQNGYAVGWKGTILSTSDGGETWSKQVSGTDNYLTRVVVASATEAWVIGDRSTVLFTRDAGQHWTKKDIPLESGTYSSINGITLKGKEVWIVSEMSVLTLSE